MEINVDSDTCEVPKLYVARMDFDGMDTWSAGCSPSNHTVFYNAIHQEDGAAFWGLKHVVKKEFDLTDVTQNNYKEMIFGTMELLSRQA